MLAKNTKRAVAILMALSLCFGTMGTAAMAVEGAHEHNPMTCEACSGSGKESKTCETCGGNGIIEKEEVCSQCGGEGRVLDVAWDTPCPVCNGAGCDAPNCYFGYILQEVECDDCNGTGHLSETCAACEGKGLIQTDANCPTCSGVGTVPCTGEFAGEVTQAATCVAEGVMTYTCAACEASYTETIPVDATAHQWGEPVAVEGKEPTCGADGTGTHTCALCEKTEEVVMPATGQHTYGDNLKCTVCGAAEPADEDTAAAIALLEALPEAEQVTADDQSAIEAARVAYDALTEHQKLFVTETVLARLSNAETALSAALVAQADALLAALSADPASNLGATFAAYNAVSALSEAEKAQLTQTDKLAALNAYMETVDLYSYSRAGQSVPGAWVVYDTTVSVAAPKGIAFSSNPASFKFVKGTSDLNSISRHLPSSCTMDAAFEMSAGLKNAAKELADGQEILVTIQSSLTASVSSYDVYFVSGSSSSDTSVLVQETELNNGTLVIHLNNKNYQKLSYIALTRSIEYTDDYTTPTTAANSYTPADHAASSDGITYGYRMDGDTRVITVTIPADYTGDTVNVNMAAIREIFGELSVGLVENGQVVAGGYESAAAIAGKGYIQPGPALAHRIEIINLSGQKYTYTSGSLWMDAAKVENYVGYVDASGAYPAFDGSSQTFAVYRTWNKALTALLNTRETLNDATINAALQAIYQNKDGIEVNLPHYYLDYYNFAYNTNAATLEQLPADALFDLFGGERDTASATADGVIFSLETLPEINNLAYNFFYTRAFQLDQSSSTASDYNTSVGAAMAGKYTALDTKAVAAWDELSAAASEPVAIEFTVTPAGPLWNAYMRYPVACDMGFTLTKVVDYVPSYNYYTVTVNYYDKDTGEKIASSYTSPSRIQGTRYDVTAYDAIAIDGYTYDSTSGDALTGTLNSNKVVNVYYVVESTDIPDDDTPTGDVPDLPDDPGETDIPDDDTPTGDLPDQPDDSGETDIPDGDVPTGDLPQTGTMADGTMNTIGMLLLAMSMATAGAAGVLWMKKSRR